MKNMLIILILLFISCDDNKREEKKAILLADREAPLGWVYLRIYGDSTFEFESRGMRTSDIFSGKAVITKDTIFFNYNDSIPKAGDKAVYSDKFVAYTNGEYPERVDVKLYNIK